jgi:murein DD-endopeptidase MepM/ murein hydrolase activator NlpD
MPSRRSVLPRAARPPLAVALVSGLLTAVIATGQPAGGLRPLAAAAAVPVAVATPSDTLDMRLVSLRTVADRASRSRHRAPLHRWVRPNGGPLTSPYGYRWGRLHAGIDLAGPYGSPILAATDGCITYAGAMSGYGEVIEITDWDGTQTVYGHMSAFERRSGCVKAGQVIARVGAAGDATGPHLHFEVRVAGVPVDPIPFLAKRGLAI